MAIVNEDFEFIVDDVLVTVVNNEVLFTSNPSDNSTRTTINNMSKGVPIDSSDVPDGVFWTSFDDLRFAIRGRSWCGCTTNIKYEDCDVLKVWGYCKNALWGEGDGSIS
jgi:hypothetical protein